MFGLCSNGMEPNVTLHWFVHPLWFEKISAFSREQNIPIFVDFARFAFSEFRAFCIPPALSLPLSICA